VLDDESGESMEPMEEVQLIGLGESELGEISRPTRQLLRMRVIAATQAAGSTQQQCNPPPKKRRKNNVADDS